MTLSILDDPAIVKCDGFNGCGPRNGVTAPADHVICYACGRTIDLGREDVDRLRGFFEKNPAGIRDDEEGDLEERIFSDLGLSPEETRYISVTDDSVSITFPVKVDFSIQVGDRGVYIDPGCESEMAELIDDFWRVQFLSGGFEPMVCMTDLSPGELTFEKSISSEEEAKEAVRWLVGFKNGFGM